MSMKRYMTVIIYILSPQPHNIEKIVSSWMATVQEVCPNLEAKAETVKEKFKTLILSFSKCHATYNAGGRIDDSQIERLGKKLDFLKSTYSFYF